MLAFSLAPAFLIALTPAAIVQADPLDPLTGAEIAMVREVLQRAGRLSPELRFATLALREPPKDAVRQQRISGSVGRTAEAVLFDWASSTPIRAHIDLRRQRIIRWDTLRSREPSMRGLIRRRLEEIVRRDPRWTEALRRRGIPDSSQVSLFPQLAESSPLPWRGSSRVVRGVGYDREGWRGSEILREIRLEVDLTLGRVLELTDLGSSPGPVRPLQPPATAVQSPTSLARPAGSAVPPFEVAGTLVRWKHWQLRFGVHPRRGLEIWDVAWIGDDGPRSILYRASVSEALAAYGDPGFPIWYPRDAGNEGLGGQNNSAVELGDAPEGALYAEAVLADDFGRPVPVPRAVAIYERDGGLLWRHSLRSRRARQLVLTSHSTIDDYDFIFNWIFGEDGAIEVEVNLTGLVLTYPAPAGAPLAGMQSASGHLVAPGVMAPSHQHFFSYRLDFDLDAASPQRVLEMDTRGIRRSRRDNPEGLWFAMTETPLESEREAVRPADASSNRIWKVVNPARKNSLGQPVGYLLVPGAVAFPYAASSSAMRRRAGFVNAQLFVTPFRRDEMYAGGEFQNFAWSGGGLTDWTAADRSLVDADLVLWHTIGLTHLPRPEEYPVMPVARAGFRLLPAGFFDRNPALPPDEPDQSQ
ncbi:MAG TPA: hypothetical protein VF234_05070 [Limnochordia bacterium]